MIITISPTQIDTWRTCQRKFAFTYLAGLPRTPSTKAQMIGIDLHAKVENYLKTGAFDVSGGTDADRLFPAILPYLPPPGTPAENKLKFELDGLTFGGKYDWHVPGVEIGDLKTTSALKWAKTKDELAVHPQGLIYMHGTGEKKGRWLYVQTKGPAHVRPVEFYPDFSALDAVIEDGHNIQRAWDTKPDPQSFPPKTSACDMYGGCPFRGVCKVSASERLFHLTQRTPVMLDPNDKLNALLAQIGAGINPPVEPPPAETIPPPAPEPEPLPPVLDPTLAASAPAAAPEATTAPAVVEPAKPKRGRPRKVATEPTSEEAADTERDPRPIGTLYVSCLPMGKDVLLADSLFANARAKVTEKTGKDDYRLIEYGQGAAGLLIEVSEMINDLRPDILVVEDGGPEARVCLSAMVAMSRNVVRRF